MCVRLLPVHVTVFGAQVAPDIVRGALMRLYELTVGLVIAANAEAVLHDTTKKVAATLG